jgi:hypothetical protein
VLPSEVLHSDVGAGVGRDAGRGGVDAMRAQVWEQRPDESCVWTSGH